jgi:hypothetical protein
MVTQLSQPVKNLATSVYKFLLINPTVPYALPSTISGGINFASGGLTLTYNDSYYKSILCQPAVKC